MTQLFTILHHGAVNGVTGSCHQLLLDDGQSVLIDCGLFQGAETSGEGAGAAQLEIGFPINKVKALVITHVHIDHVGRIPYLLAAGFKGPIYCSRASAALLPLVLEDALKVGVTRDKALIERFLAHIAKQIVPIDYKHWQSVIGGDLRIPRNLDTHSTANWTVIPRESGQSERSDAGVGFYSVRPFVIKFSAS